MKAAERAKRFDIQRTVEVYESVLYRVLKK